MQLRVTALHPWVGQASIEFNILTPNYADSLAPLGGPGLQMFNLKPGRHPHKAPIFDTAEPKLNFLNLEVF